jgi:hypothetical protein
MNDQELLTNLRVLGGEETAGAPPRVEEFLIAAFRQRARRRRAAFWISAGAGLIAAGLAVLAWMPGRDSRVGPANAGIPATQEMAEEPVAPVGLDPEAPRANDAVVHTDDVSESFYPLPEAEGLPPADDVTVVRVQLTAGALEMMGVPWNETEADPVQADLLLGQDGLARGVRIVE